MLVVYAVLLAASFGVRYFQRTGAPAPDKRLIQFSVGKEKPVKIAFKETGEEFKGIPVVFVHGSPGTSETFDNLTSVLPNRHIIAIDLPGFGDSQHDVPDYSITAHAKYLDAFLRHKNIAKAHLVGFSFGGGVVLEAANLAPDRVASISFISSIGVQEYELLGNYYINHAIHGLQLAAAWSLRELTPHFGIFDGNLVTYSRNFYDTDQRPLRGLLQQTEKPILIIHGKDDPLVPVEVAREQARLVPQSEYHEIEDNHFFVFMRPQKASPLLNDFWKRVEDGTAVTRQNAQPLRTKVAAEPFHFKIIPAMGATVFCFFILFFLIAVVNEDFASLLAGIFVAQGRFGPLLPVLAIFLAIVFSTIIWRRIGRRKLGSAAAYIPYSLESKRALTFGFRFQYYLGRSRDSFFEYIGGSVFHETWRALLFGAVSFGVAWLLVNTSVVDVTSSFYLLASVFVTYLMVIFAFAEKKKRRY